MGEEGGKVGGFVDRGTLLRLHFFLGYAMRLVGLGLGFDMGFVWGLWSSEMFGLWAQASVS